MVILVQVSWNPCRYHSEVSGAPAPSQNRLSVPMNLFADEELLKLKTCLTAQVGFDYILTALEKTFDQYA